MAPTIDELILGIEVEREQALKRRDRATETVKVILAKARNGGRATLTAEEDAEVAGEFQKRERAKADLIGINSRYDSAVKIREMERENDVRMADTRANPAIPHDAGRLTNDREHRVGGARVVSEERTYHQGNDRKGGRFLNDVVRQFLYRDPEAETRLMHHMQEERAERGQYLERAAGTGAFAGLTVPQYLTDMYAPAVAALRPFADQCNKHELPASGMTVNISRITTSTSAAVQATENVAVSEQNIDDTLLTENVQTVAGQQTLSRQAIERGTGVEEIVMDDLFRRYATTLDSTLINTATTGLAAVSTAQTYTGTTSPATYSAIIGAAASVEGVLLGWAQPDMVVMHSRRWYKLLSAVSATWPMIFGAGSRVPEVQATGTNTGKGYAQGIRGYLANGLAICVDNNVSTIALGTALTGGTQDQMYVVPSQECHLWEDPNAPVFLRAEQAAAASLGVLMVLYGYFAYSFRRFSGATVVINGTGLVPPTFDGT